MNALNLAPEGNYQPTHTSNMFSTSPRGFSSAAFSNASTVVTSPAITRDLQVHEYARHGDAPVQANWPPFGQPEFGAEGNVEESSFSGPGFENQQQSSNIFEGTIDSQIDGPSDLMENEWFNNLDISGQANNESMWEKWTANIDWHQQTDT